MPKDISIKELRENLSDVADRAEKGETFRVIRRSKPSKSPAGVMSPT